MAEDFIYVNPAAAQQASQMLAARLKNEADQNASLRDYQSRLAQSQGAVQAADINAQARRDAARYAAEAALQNNNANRAAREAELRQRMEMFNKDIELERQSAGLGKVALEDRASAGRQLLADRWNGNYQASPTPETLNKWRNSPDFEHLQWDDQRKMFLPRYIPPRAWELAPAAPSSVGNLRMLDSVPPSAEDLAAQLRPIPPTAAAMVQTSPSGYTPAPARTNAAASAIPVESLRRRDIGRGLSVLPDQPVTSSDIGMPEPGIGFYDPDKEFTNWRNRDLSGRIPGREVPPIPFVGLFQQDDIRPQKLYDRYRRPSSDAMKVVAPPLNYPASAFDEWMLRMQQLEQ